MADDPGALQLPAIGRLDVWSVRNVRSMKHLDDQLHVIRHVPGPWEEELKKLAEQSAVSSKPQERGNYT
jgi:hypothetical protein